MLFFLYTILKCCVNTVLYWFLAYSSQINSLQAIYRQKLIVKKFIAITINRKINYHRGYNLLLSYSSPIQFIAMQSRQASLDQNAAFNNIPTTINMKTIYNCVVVHRKHFPTTLYVLNVSSWKSNSILLSPRCSCYCSWC